VSSEAHASPRGLDLTPGRLTAAAAVCATALAAGALAHFGAGPRGLISAGFIATLCALAAIDLDRRLIPNRIVLPAAAAVLAANLAFYPEWAGPWIVAGLGAALVLFLPSLFNAGAIGMGDVKLGLLLGFGLGVEVLNALVLGWLATLPVILWLFATRGREARKQTIPLGPFLAIGGVAALFIGDLPV
jgi:leader peptidase (prepilin peptidase)/N-methyltransferase